MNRRAPLAEKHKRLRFYDCHMAIRDGNALAPCGIAWRLEGYNGHWYLFELTEGADKGTQVEFICIGQGRVPIPVSDSAREIVRQMMQSD